MSEQWSWLVLLVLVLACPISMWLMMRGMHKKTDGDRRGASSGPDSRGEHPGPPAPSS